MKISQVLKLTNQNYEETVIESIFPNWDHQLKSTHTINSVDHLTVIDALMTRRK